MPPPVRPPAAPPIQTGKPPALPVKGNFAPVATDDAVVTKEDTPIVIPFASILANDLDRNADALTVTAVDKLVNVGKFGFGKDSFTLLPPQNFSGTSTFEYQVSDGKGGFDVGLVTVTVTPVNDAPNISGPLMAAAVEDGSAVAINALSNASDVDSPNLSVVDLPAVLPDGVTFDASINQFSLDPSHSSYQSLMTGDSVNVDVVYGVSDGTATSVQTASWSVAGVSDIKSAAITPTVLGTAASDMPLIPDRAIAFRWWPEATPETVYTAQLEFLIPTDMGEISQVSLSISDLEDRYFPRGTVSVYAYAADGVLTSEDQYVVGSKIASTVVSEADTLNDGYTLNLDPSGINDVLSAGDWLGLRLEVDEGGWYGIDFRSAMLNFDYFG